MQQVSLADVLIVGVGADRLMTAEMARRAGDGERLFAYPARLFPR